MKKLISYPYNLYLRWYYKRRNKILDERNLQYADDYYNYKFNPWSILTFYLVSFTLFLLTGITILGIILIVKNI